jgi:clan AA aspartic protease
MIRGTVNAKLEAFVTLHVLGPNDHSLKVEAEVDTGFSGYLVLDKLAIEALALRRFGVNEGTLADGSRTRFETYTATLDWHGAVRPVIVVSSDGGSLVGMSLLRGSRLLLEVIEHGQLTIELV